MLAVSLLHPEGAEDRMAIVPLIGCALPSVIFAGVVFALVLM